MLCKSTLRQNKCHKKLLLKNNENWNNIGERQNASEACRARLTHFTRGKTFAFFLWHCSRSHFKPNAGFIKRLARLWFRKYSHLYNYKSISKATTQHLIDIRMFWTCTKKKKNEIVSPRPTCLIFFPAHHVQSVMVASLSLPQSSSTTSMAQILTPTSDDFSQCKKQMN